MQTILRLIQYDRLLAVKHPRGDFLATMRRQAMHHDCIRASALQQSLIQLIGGESF